MADEENEQNEPTLGQPDAEDAAEAMVGAEDALAEQLGLRKYILAAYFAGTMLLGYVLSMAIESWWVRLASRDWFLNAMPTVATLSEGPRATLSGAMAALISLVVMFQAYRKPELRIWSDEVATELSKVKWPNKKEVTNSTVVVIAASAVAVVYLALLDRLWGFVTDRIYAF